MSYSAVTRAFQRFKKELEDNRELQNKIKGLEKRLSAFKACPLSSLWMLRRRMNS
jgi:hypothetical protein